jgi:flagellar M-ring protein FliF
VIKWIAAVLILLIFYKKVIAPFARRMMEISKEEQTEDIKQLLFDEEEDIEEQRDNAKLQRLIKKQIDLSETDIKKKLRYEAYAKALREKTEEDPEAAVGIIKDLLGKSGGRQSR